MRKIVLFAVLMVVFLFEVALADSVNGKWAGTLSVSGKDYSASIRFIDDSFSASANGYTVTGKYSLSGSSVKLKAMGYSMTLKLRERSGKQVLSGSARGLGKSGTITVSRNAPAEITTEDSIGLSEAQSASGEWAAETSGHRFLLQLYKAGFAYWQERKLGGETEITLCATLNVEDKELVLVPLDTADDALDQSVLAQWWDEDAGAYRIPYALAPDSLTLGDSLTFSPTKQPLDDKPAEAPFLPYLNLGRGDRGEAVAWLQQRLIDLGYLDGMADGDFGPKTTAAVKRFQTDNAMAVDGVAGRAFMEQINP